MVKKPNKHWLRFSRRYVQNTNVFEREHDKILTSSYDEIFEFVQSQVRQWVHVATPVQEQNGGGTVDYKKLFSTMRGFASKIETEVYKQYNRISTEMEKLIRTGFFDYRKDIDKTLRDTGAKVEVTKEEQSYLFGLEEATAPTITATFKGTPTKSFKKKLDRMLKAGQHPASMIKSVSQQHVGLIHKNMMVAVTKGKGHGWTMDKVVREIYGKGVDDQIRQQMRYNVERIARTSYRDAVNSDVSDFVVANKDAFYGSRRVADGRPCIVCVALDGTFIPRGKTLVDHPNGMCLQVPLTYPPEYFRTGKVTEFPKDSFGPTLLEKFYKLPEVEQRKMMGKATYELWKKEQFDIRYLVSEKMTAKPYYRVLQEYKKWGAISNPQVSFGLARNEAAELLKVMDPADRVLADQVVMTKQPVGGFGFSKKSGLDLGGDGTDMFECLLWAVTEADSVIKKKKCVKSKVTMSTEEVVQLLSEYPVEQGWSMFWTEFNAMAKKLGIYTRKSKDGSLYFMVPKEVANKLGVRSFKIIGQDPVLIKKNFPKGKFVGGAPPAKLNAPSIPPKPLPAPTKPHKKTPQTYKPKPGTKKPLFQREPKAKLTKKDLKPLPGSEEVYTLDEFVKLSNRVNLSRGTGLEKIRWTKEGQARIYCDGVFVEGQSIEIVKVFDVATGKEFYRFRFKITESHSQKIWNANAGSVTTTRKFPTVAISNGKRITSTVTPYHSQQSVVMRGRFSFYGKPLNKSHVTTSYTNSMIYDSIPGKSLEEALKGFRRGLKKEWGVEKKVLKPITKDDMAEYAKARVRWAEKVEPDRDYHPSRLKSLDEIKIRVEDGYESMLRTVPENKLEEVLCLIHDMNSNAFERVFDAGKLLSTEQRIGVGVNNALSGMSSVSDLGTGGANGVFTRLRNHSSDVGKFASHRRIRLVIDKTEMNRLDWYGFTHDTYGDINQIASSYKGRVGVIEELGGSARSWENSNEQIFRHSIPISKVQRVIVGGQSEYTEIMNMLRSKGIKEMNGMPIEEWVVKGWKEK